MLRDDVVDAVRQEMFTVYAISHVDEAVSLLTGIEAGERGDNGQFTEGSVNAKVEEQLIRYARLRKAFAEPEQRAAKDDDSE